MTVPIDIEARLIKVEGLLLFILNQLDVKPEEVSHWLAAQKRVNELQPSNHQLQQTRSS